MQTRGYATRTSTTSMVPSFPQIETTWSTPSQMAGRSSFRVGGRSRRCITPSNVQFFNTNWKCTGDKSMLARILTGITRVPEHILEDGLFGNCPCVTQIMSWAAFRTTCIEDRAYSLMGLLDLNMPMLYGEGKKAFHRLHPHVQRPKHLCAGTQRIGCADWQHPRGRSELVLKQSCWITTNSSNLPKMTGVALV